MAKNSTSNQDQTAKGATPAGAGGGLEANNTRGSGETAPQGEGKINKGTDKPAQGIDNINNEAELKMTAEMTGKSAEELQKANVDPVAAAERDQRLADQGETATGDQDGAKPASEGDRIQGRGMVPQETPRPIAAQDPKARDDEKPSLGWRRARPDINNSYHGSETAIREAAANLIDLVNGLNAPAGADSDTVGDFKRAQSSAITSIQQGLHWTQDAIQLSTGR